ncbi:shieldin complex subunit 2 [Pelodytes ibericus]
MSNKGAVHIFIGAPTTSLSPRVYLEERPPIAETRAWNEKYYVYNKQCLYFHKNDIECYDMLHQVSHTDVSLDNLPEMHMSRCCSLNSCVDAPKPLITSSRFTDCGDECVENIQRDGNITDLVSNTKHCNIVSNSQKSLENVSGVLHEYLDATFPAGSRQPVGERVASSTLVTTTETEYLTVFTSSQIALSDHGGVYEQGLSYSQNKKVTSLSLEPSLSKVNSKTTTCLHEVSDGSLELFTPTSTDDLNPQISHSEENEWCLQGLSNLHFEKPSNSPNFKNVASKRPRSYKENITLSHPVVEISQKSKKCKPSAMITENEVSSEMKNIFLNLSDSLVLLKNCNEKKKEYNILAVVLHPCNLKEIQVKTGSYAGSSIPLATVVVLDQSVVEHKIVMWRSAAFWTLVVFPGDIIILTHLMACDDKWNGETLLQSTARSRLLNIGCCSVLYPQVNANVNCTVLRDLLEHISVKYPFIRDLPPRQLTKPNSIPYVRLVQLKPEILVHSVLKVSDISTLTECTYHYKGQRQNKILLSVEEVKGHTGTLVLWGTCISWADRIRLKKDHIFEFKYLFTHRNSVSREVELHSTPWSSCECLFDDDSKAVDFKKRYLRNAILNAKETDLRGLLEQKYSGEILLNASILDLQFPGSEHHHISMDHSTRLSDILIHLPEIVYLGCGKCRRKLKTDDNYVYKQCLSCLPFNQLKMFYKPALMTVKNRECRVQVHVTSDVLEKIFLNITPNLLNNVVLCSTNVTYGMVVADLCHSLLAQTEESYILKIRSQFVLDENSIPLEQEFDLLDFHLNI